MDGVQEARSNTVSTDVFSIKFDNCRHVYPIRLVRPINRYKVNEQEQLQEVLDDLNSNSLNLQDIISDNIKRSSMKLAKNSNATYGCEYCESCAIQPKDLKGIENIKKKINAQRKNIEEQIKMIQSRAGPSSDLKKIEDLTKLKNNLVNDEKKEISSITSRHLFWPASTFNGTPRTIESIEEITNKIQNSNQELSRHEAKGFYGKSILLSQPNFHFVYNISAEYMHSVCIGAVKRLTELTFAVGENRPRITKRKLCDPKMYNELIKLVKVAKEFSRRCRNLDFSVMKASEFRNLILFFL